MKTETLKKISKVLFFFGALTVIVYAFLLAKANAGEALPIAMLFIFPLAIVLYFASTEHALFLSLASLSASMAIFCTLFTGNFDIEIRVLCTLLLGAILYFRSSKDKVVKNLLTIAIAFSFFCNFVFISSYLSYLADIAILLVIIVLLYMLFHHFKQKREATKS